MQRGGHVMRGPVPVGIEVPCPRIKEEVARRVGGLDWIEKDVHVERLAKGVCVNDVEAAVLDHRRYIAKGIDNARDAWPDLRRHARTTRNSLEVGRPDKVEQVRVLRLVERKRATD